MKLDFVGTGTVTAAIVDGLGLFGTDASIILSPRNARTATALAARASGVLQPDGARRKRHGDDRRPATDCRQGAPAAALSSESPDREPRRCPSPLAYLHQMLAPASQIIRAVPLPSVARGADRTRTTMCGSRRTSCPTTSRDHTFAELAEEHRTRGRPERTVRPCDRAWRYHRTAGCGAGRGPRPGHTLHYLVDRSEVVTRRLDPDRALDVGRQHVEPIADRRHPHVSEARHLHSAV